MDAAKPRKRRWFHVTPDRLVIGLLVVECLLWLSNWLGWWHKGYPVLASIAVVGVVLVFMLLWLVVALIFRLRFQFFIRSLLVLVVAVALPFSWLGVEVKKAKEDRELADEIAKAGGSVNQIDWVTDMDFLLPEIQLSGPASLSKIFGDYFFRDVFWSVLESDAPIERLKRWPKLRGIQLRGRVTDAGIARLKGNRQLYYVNLSGSEVTDSGIDCLTGLAQLKVIKLTDTRVTVAAMKKFQQGLPNCQIVR
jgi:hypothetical protein